MNYSYLKTLVKGLKYWVIFGLSFLLAGFVSQYPGIADKTIIDFLVNTAFGKITIGGFLVMVLNWLKNRLGVRMP